MSLVTVCARCWAAGPAHSQGMEQLGPRGDTPSSPDLVPQWWKSAVTGQAQTRSSERSSSPLSFSQTESRPISRMRWAGAVSSEGSLAEGLMALSVGPPVPSSGRGKRCTLSASRVSPGSCHQRGSLSRDAHSHATDMGSPTLAEEGAQAPEPASPPQKRQPPAPLQIHWLEQSPR